MKIFNLPIYRKILIFKLWFQDISIRFPNLNCKYTSLADSYKEDQNFRVSNILSSMEAHLSRSNITIIWEALPDIPQLNKFYLYYIVHWWSDIKLFSGCQLTSSWSWITPPIWTTAPQTGCWDKSQQRAPSFTPRLWNLFKAADRSLGFYFI